ncbi:MAG TPA: polysaccharide biosynthesis/export family protein, partial [Thermosynechococcaceae cyanobacterium]
MVLSRPTSSLRNVVGLSMSFAIATVSVTLIAPLATAQAIAPSAEAESSVPVVKDEAYTLGAGDRVRIDVFKLAQYSGENQVLVDGTLNLAEVGSVAVQGMTLKEASDAVSQAYAPLLKYPVATVTLIAPRPVRVGVSGEVNRAGAFTLLTTEGGSQLPTVTRALQQAGGVTQMANLREVEVRRVRRGGVVETLKVNLWEFLQTGDLSRDITLRGGDSIYIPSVSAINLAESVQISGASFAADRSQPLNIAVVGEVYRPGPYTVTASTQTG